MIQSRLSAMRETLPIRNDGITFVADACLGYTERTPIGERGRAESLTKLSRRLDAPP